MLKIVEKVGTENHDDLSSISLKVLNKYGVNIPANMKLKLGNMDPSLPQNMKCFLLFEALKLWNQENRKQTRN